MISFDLNTILFYKAHFPDAFLVKNRQGSKRSFCNLLGFQQIEQLEIFLEFGESLSVEGLIGANLVDVDATAAKTPQNAPKALSLDPTEHL